MADFVRVPEADWQNILDAVRGKTGSTEKMVSGVVASEIAGIQSGGTSDSPGSASGIYMAQITPAEDTDEVTVTHNLGTTDILMACCWAETFGDVTPTIDGSVANVYLKSNVPFRASSSSTHENMIAFAKWSVASANVSTVGQPTSGTYFPKPIDENNFKFDSAGSASAKYFAGVTYTVIVMAASAFTDMGV